MKTLSVWQDKIKQQQQQKQQQKQQKYESFSLSGQKNKTLRKRKKRLWNSLALPKLLLFSKATTKIYCKYKHWQNKENKNILCSIYVINLTLKIVKM